LAGNIQKGTFSKNAREIVRTIIMEENLGVTRQNHKAVGDAIGNVFKVLIRQQPLRCMAHIFSRKRIIVF